MLWTEAAAEKEVRYLYAVIPVCKIVHGLVLFVDDADAGFVGADGDRFDIFGGFTLLLKLGVDEFCGLDSSLGMKFGWGGMSAYCVG